MAIVVPGDKAKGDIRTMLRQRYPREDIEGLLLPREAWRPFPPSADRAAWEDLQTHQLNRKRAGELIGRAESLLGEPWPVIPATAHMAFWRNGDRKVFERPYFDRRRRLATLVLAECFEHAGRFVDEIINGLWAICEETSWCVSAHSYSGDVSDGHDLLPRPEAHGLAHLPGQDDLILRGYCHRSHSNLHR